MPMSHVGFAGKILLQNKCILLSSLGIVKIMSRVLLMRNAGKKILHNRNGYINDGHPIDRWGIMVITEEEYDKLCNLSDVGYSAIDALSRCGIAGIYDGFSCPADAITQMAHYINENSPLGSDMRSENSIKKSIRRLRRIIDNPNTDATTFRVAYTIESVLYWTLGMDTGRPEDELITEVELLVREI